MIRGLIRIYTICYLVLNFWLISLFATKTHVQIRRRKSPLQKLRDKRVNHFTSCIFTQTVICFSFTTQQPIYSPRPMVYPRIRQLYQISFIIDLPHASYGPQTEWLFFPNMFQKVGDWLTMYVVRPIVVMFVVFFFSHYENSPIQIYGIFHLQKLKIYR